jgi:hypothetical protein
VHAEGKPIVRDDVRQPGGAGRARLIALAGPLAALVVVAVVFLIVWTPSATAGAATSKTPAPAGVDRSGVARWAVANSNWGGWNPLFVKNDCTDFVSRALHFGGGLGEVAPARSQQSSHDNKSNYWYFEEQPQLTHTYSKTWSEAPWSYRYQVGRGGKPVARASVAVGDIAYVNLHGDSQAGIDHAGIVTEVTPTNIYVAQQSSPNSYVPVFDAQGRASWQSVFPKMTPFFVDPSAER